MKNTQQVYAGYTYGRDNLVETCQDSDSSRGFWYKNPLDFLCAQLIVADACKKKFVAHLHGI